MPTFFVSAEHKTLLFGQQTYFSQLKTRHSEEPRRYQESRFNARSKQQ
ncbi:hypothetical protein THOE12_110163 [Vibrio rotiferianus]|nr:hypothetical protein THOE12_110163 [Vibrio rotiferianus]